VSRIFVGVGASAALAISAATVSSSYFEDHCSCAKCSKICDMFFQGERGRFMGFYALAITNGVSQGKTSRRTMSLTRLASFWSHCWRFRCVEPRVEMDFFRKTSKLCSQNLVR
jgi:hypothetical protein